MSFKANALQTLEKFCVKCISNTNTKSAHEFQIVFEIVAFQVLPSFVYFSFAIYAGATSDI